ncbi:MAG: ATP-binding protein [Corynebacterium sp.]|nr:ATP-binding protein [Corynebacterium sp.]
MTVLAAYVLRPLHQRRLQRQGRGTKSPNKVTTVSQVLHLTVQGSPTGITVIDQAGTVVLSNAQAHAMGVVHERSVHPEIFELAAEVFQDQEERAVELLAAPSAHGSRITAVRALVKMLTLVDDRYVVIFSTDESENQRMEAARRDFVANVSHELKTPVGGMALLAEALTQGSDDPEQVEYFGKKLHKEALRLAEMINELISLSKLQGAEALPDLEPLSVDEVIDEAIARNTMAAEGVGITLTRAKPSGAQVLGERGLLVSAISNLVANAIHYSPPGTPVSITTKVTADDQVLIRVIDRGIGIALEHQDRVFERFFRVDKARSRSTGGTGLGLAIVKHVAANLGGQVDLWSRPGIGSTFTIILPRYNPAAADHQVTEIPALEQSRLRRGLGRKETEL